MEDLQIAYYFGVIMIGFAAVAISGFWAFKTREVDLWNFCFVYTAFTFVLIVSVLKKYLSLNVEEYSPSNWYAVSGVYYIFNCSVVAALIHFLLGAYKIAHRRLISSIVLLTMLISIGLIYSPIGAVLDEDSKIIHLGAGFIAASIWYLLTFTFALAVGFVSLRHIWNTDRRNLILGLLIFALFGYGESLFNAPGGLRIHTASFGEEGVFLYSSIPYLLYGIFVIHYFLNFSPPTPIIADTLSESFLSAYGITDREREIIEKVIEGKSNAIIASELIISLATVKTHLHNIYSKTGVKSRFDLLAKVRSAK
ncbi:MAG: helix-turn-helix transcriptional regulator [Anaerolineales bacterium]|nr:helix-turn-helix transcriptional regulator [Anaerolineales bacterium]